MKEKIYDVIIIGSGPSGLTAAIYASRADLSTLVIGGNPPGGQLTITTDVENFPGFPEGIMGPDLVNKMREQAAKFGAEFIDENVSKNPVKEINNGKFTFYVPMDSGVKYLSRSLIIATGASANWLGLDNEHRLIGKGVSACATCDAFFFKDKTVAVVGGGDSAMEEALYLTKFASKVYILVRKGRGELRASKIMQNRAFENEKIEFVFNVEVIDVLGQEAVSGVHLRKVLTGEEYEMSLEGLFVAIGHSPNTAFLTGFMDIDKKGYAMMQEGSKSSVEGVFVAGDVHDHLYRQAITAAGFGCMAALDAERFLAAN